MPQDGRDVRRRVEWIAHGERTIYASEWLNLNLVDVTDPAGRRFEHHVVRMREVAVSAVMDETGEHLLMLRRHRFIDDSWGWEVPVGIVETGESSNDAAAREVLEETGWRPTRMAPALSFQPAIGIADSRHDLFVSLGAEHIGPPTDPTEAEVVRWVPLDDLQRMIAAGEIRDGATLVAALYVTSLRGRP